MDDSPILIDTSVLIDYFRKKNKEKTLLYALSLKHNFAVSTITEFAFLVGLTDKHLDFVNKLFKDFHVLPFDTECARIAADIYRDLRSRNQLLPPPDIFIATTAVSYNLSLSTLNVDHFGRVKKLRLYKAG